MVQESPYSVYVTLRKKFSDKVTRTSQTHFQKTESSSSDTSKHADVVVHSSDTLDATKALLEKKEVEYLKAQDIIKILESKLEKSEAEIFEAFMINSVDLRYFLCHLETEVCVLSELL